MKNLNTLLFLVLAVAAAFSISCGNDSPTATPQQPSGYLALSQKGNVLHNFELAHNRRNSNHYDAELDDNFTFFYIEPDGGAGTPVQWGHSEDVLITNAMFSGIDDIVFDIDTSSVSWEEVPAGSESWYRTTLYYHYTVKIGESTYIPNAGAKMEFTLRNAGTNDAPAWRLVELRDLGGPTLLSAVEAVATQATTYGMVKAKFRN